MLRPGAPLLVGFQAGADEKVERTNAHDTPHTLVSYRHDPDAVTGRLVAAGFTMLRTATRPAALAHETTPQAFVLARAAAACRSEDRP